MRTFDDYCDTHSLSSFVYEGNHLFFIFSICLWTMSEIWCLIHIMCLLLDLTCTAICVTAIPHIHIVMATTTFVCFLHLFLDKRNSPFISVIAWAWQCPLQCIYSVLFQARHIFVSPPVEFLSRMDDLRLHTRRGGFMGASFKGRSYMRDAFQSLSAKKKKTVFHMAFPKRKSPPPPTPPYKSATAYAILTRHGHYYTGSFPSFREIIALVNVHIDVCGYTREDGCRENNQCPDPQPQIDRQATLVARCQTAALHEGILNLFKFYAVWLSFQ